VDDIRVDAYTATVQGSGSDAVEWLVSAVPEKEQVLVGREGKIALWKYDHGVAILDGKTTVACVRWGGNGGGTSIELKGSVAHEVYQSLRDRYPFHAVSRIDAAVDRTRKGLFDQAHADLMAIAQQTNPRVSSEPAGKGWDQPGEYGRTKYFGTRESNQHVILYEKGFERRDRAGVNPSELDFNHVRLECSLHPAKRLFKEALAMVTPLQVFGASPWTREMLHAFTGIEASTVKIPARQSDDERTYAALLQQYGKFITKQYCAKGDGFFTQILTDQSGYEDFRANIRRA
jgi:hypothetical protein